MLEARDDDAYAIDEARDDDAFVTLFVRLVMLDATEEELTPTTLVREFTST